MEDQEPPLVTHEITEAKAPAKPMPDAQPANEAAKTEEDERGLLSMMVSGLGKFFSKKERARWLCGGTRRQPGNRAARGGQVPAPTTRQQDASPDKLPEPLPLARPTPVPVIPVRIGDGSSVSGSPHPSRLGDPFEPPRVIEERPRIPLPVASAPPREAAPPRNTSDEFAKRIVIGSLPRRTRKEITGRTAAPTTVRNQTPPRRLAAAEQAPDGVLPSVKISLPRRLRNRRPGAGLDPTRR